MPTVLIIQNSLIITIIFDFPIISLFIVNPYSHLTISTISYSTHLTIPTISSLCETTLIPIFLFLYLSFLNFIKISLSHPKVPMHIGFTIPLLTLYSLINHIINHTLSFSIPFTLLIVSLNLITNHISIISLLIKSLIVVV